ncbi:hypothetical protein KAW65_07385 [candidate division WOR-3 bacterium]|nr:hypothetical protein [candidate division WOR-3 bacterium]
MQTRKSWREKLEKEQGLPKIVDIPPKMIKRLGQGKMLIPKPCKNCSNGTYALDERST